MAAALAGLALAASACSGQVGQPGPGGTGGAGGAGGASGSSARAGAAAGTSSDKSAEVTIELTPGGCQPRPSTITAGHVFFTVSNKNAPAVTEAELRSGDFAYILGEQENLPPGVSGGFGLTIQPGNYKISCPGAARSRWNFRVTGHFSGPGWQSIPQLALAVRHYTSYVDTDAAALVQHTRAFCRAVRSGDMTKARLLYPRARVYYERIEPVAEIWGSVDTEIDGRWGNPVTQKSQFVGFHRIEQLMWQDSTLKGAPTLCAALVRNEQLLLQLVNNAQYSPLEMASGSTDLINEAGSAKITGEEERYSSTDFIVFKANVDGAMEVVRLLTPYLSRTDPGLLSLIRQRDRAVLRLLATYQASPGYDSTGYVVYTAVTKPERRALSTVVSALATALSQVSEQVSK